MRVLHLTIGCLLLLPAAGVSAATAAGGFPAPGAAERRVHQYLRQHWSLEEGLPQVGVRALAQDNKGFLWVGTQDGLARFDGANFQVFDVDHTPGLAGDIITRLLHDRHSRLWIGTQTGLSRYDGRSFERLQRGNFDLGAVHELAETGGEILVSSDAGLFRSSGGGITPVAGAPAGRAFMAAARPGGALLVGLSGRIHEMAERGTREYTLAPFGAGVVPKRYLCGCGGEWIASTAGLFRLGEGGLSRVEALAQRNINALHCDPGGTLWAGTASGLYRLKDGRVVEAIDKGESLPYLWVASMLAGSDGGLWIGTNDSGLYRLTRGRYLRFGKPDGLSFDKVYALFPSADGSLWIGGQGGLERFAGGRFEPLARNLQLPDRVVMTLLEDRAGFLWIGTRSGLVRTRNATGKAQLLLTDPVMSFAEDADGTVWIGGLSGLYSSRGKEIRRQGGQDGISRVRAILPSRRHGLVVGTELGLFARPEGSGETAPFHRLDQQLFKDAKRVGALHEDEHGDLWVGYLGEGLARHSAVKNAWSLYTERDGLLSNVVYHIAVARDARLWISTPKGVTSIDRVELARLESDRTGPAGDARPAGFFGLSSASDTVVSIAGREAGSSPGYCCNGGGSASGAIAPDGALWYPTLDGVIRIDPQRPAEAPPPLFIELMSMRHGNGAQAFPAGGPLRLPSNDRNVEFSFSAASFTKPALTRFFYRLDPYDGDWRDSRGSRLAPYPNLPPGSYEFRVRAQSADGAKSENEAVWAIAITPRFSETAWFFALLAGLAGGAAYLAYSMRLRSLEKQRTRLENLVAERTTQLQDTNEALARANLQLQEQTHTDPLTRLKNRRYLADRIEQDLAQLLRLRRQPGAQDLHIIFLLTDIDHFKRINDTFGHEAGDQVLVESARRLQAAARGSDYVVRWGGEEFLLVACFVPLETAPRIAQRLMEALWGDPFPLAGRPDLHVTGSMGFAALPPAQDTGHPAPVSGPVSWQAAITRADEALYTAKQAGRNCWRGVDPEGGAGTEARAQASGGLVPSLSPEPAGEGVAG